MRAEEEIIPPSATCLDGRPRGFPLTFSPLPPALKPLLAILFAAIAAILHASPPAAADARLEELVSRALESSQELVVASERVVIASQRAIRQGALDDPMLMLGIDNGVLRDPLAFDRDPATAKVIGVSQMLPFYGKRDLRRRGGEFEAEAEQERLLDKRLDIRRQVSETWLRIGLVDGSLRTVDETIDALGDLLRISETMYGVGRGEQQDVLGAQLERTRMEEMRLTLRGDRQRLVATLNGLAYLPADTPLAAVTLPDIGAPPAGVEELLSLALSRRPLFKAQAALLEKSLVGRELAEREFYPDLTLSLEYMQKEGSGMTGDDMYGLSLSMNLPVQQGRRQAMVAEAGAEYRMLLAEFDTMRNDLRRMLGESLAGLARSRALVTLYRGGMVEQAAARHETLVSSYRVGRAGFAAVLDGRMALYDIERRLQQALAEYNIELAALEALAGGAVNGGEKR